MISGVHVYLLGLLSVAVAAIGAWCVSLYRGKVDVVDSLWPLLFALAAYTYAGSAYPIRTRGVVILTLVTLWALRLSIYITWRNWGHGEDRRYQAIRARNQSNFAFKSLYLVFGLQAVLAWIISLPLYSAIARLAPLNWLDLLGGLLWTIGVIFEAGADLQMARFKADPTNRTGVMDRGFWRYTRHPNYFGDFCVWWGFYLLALAAGGWWSIPGPLLMTLLLTRVSGVTLLEKDIGARRADYADYVRRTNAFFPGKPKLR